jgi:hypothetical protein
MGWTLFIGFALLGAGTFYVRFVLFGHDPIAASDNEAPTVSAARSVARPVTQGSLQRPDAGPVAIRWWERGRAVIGLLVIMAGLGATLAVVIGGAIFVLSLLLG